MNKADIEKRVAAEGFTNVQAKKAVDAVLSAIKEGTHAEGSVQIKGFGTFKIHERKEREGRNPATGKPITIPAKDVVKFSPSF